MANVKKREYNGVHGADEAVELCTQKPETRWVCGGTEMRGIACEKNEKKKGRVRLFNGVGWGYTSILEAYRRAHNSECYLRVLAKTIEG